MSFSILGTNGVGHEWMCALFVQYLLFSLQLLLASAAGWVQCWDIVSMWVKFVGRAQIELWRISLHRRGDKQHGTYGWACRLSAMAVDNHARRFGFLWPTLCTALGCTRKSTSPSSREAVCCYRRNWQGWLDPSEARSVKSITALLDGVPQGW